MGESLKNTSQKDQTPEEDMDLQAKPEDDNDNDLSFLDYDDEEDKGLTR